MKVEGRFGDAVELHQSTFGKGPKSFDAVDVAAATGKFILAMRNTIVLLKSEIDQAVVTAPAI